MGSCVRRSVAVSASVSVVENEEGNGKSGGMWRRGSVLDISGRRGCYCRESSNIFVMRFYASFITSMWTLYNFLPEEPSHRHQRYPQNRGAELQICLIHSLASP